MYNKKSKCNNILIIIKILEEKQIFDDFISFCTQRKKEPKYIQLLQEINNRIKSGENSDDEIEEEYLNNWVIEQKWGESLSGYLKEIYPKLIAYLAEWYKTQNQSEFERTVEQVCWEVEALCELHEIEQAKGWLMQKEKEVFEAHNAFHQKHWVWQSVLSPAFLIKYLGLRYNFQILSTNQSLEWEISQKESDLYTHMAHILKNYTEDKNIEPNDRENELLQKERSFYAFLEQYAKSIQDHKQQALLLDQELPSYRNSYNFFPQEPQKKAHNQNYTEAQRYIKLLRLLHLSEQAGARELYSTLEKIGDFINYKSVNSLSSYFTHFILSLHHHERTLTHASSDEWWEKIANTEDSPFFSEQEINDVLCRFEINKIIMLFIRREYKRIWQQYFHKDINIVRKKVFRSWRNELKILRMLVFFEYRLEDETVPNFHKIGKKREEIDDTTSTENFDDYLKGIRRDLKILAKKESKYCLANEIIGAITPYRNISVADEWKKETFNTLSTKGVLKRNNCKTPLDRLLFLWLNPSNGENE